MGGSQSVEIPGGGTEGYHVLRVQVRIQFVHTQEDFILNDDPISGQFSRVPRRPRGLLRLHRGHRPDPAGPGQRHPQGPPQGQRREGDRHDRLQQQDADRKSEIRSFNEQIKRSHSQVREVFITPSTLWGGQGLLGISIRFCSFEGANENVWHILDVQDKSPAEAAGLRPFTDFVIGEVLKLFVFRHIFMVSFFFFFRRRLRSTRERGFVHPDRSPRGPATEALRLQHRD